MGGGGEGEEIDLPNIPEQAENPDLEQDDLPMNAGGLLTHTHTHTHTETHTHSDTHSHTLTLTHTHTLFIFADNFWET